MLSIILFIYDLNGMVIYNKSATMVTDLVGHKLNH